MVTYLFILAVATLTAGCDHRTQQKLSVSNLHAQSLMEGIKHDPLLRTIEAE